LLGYGPADPDVRLHRSIVGNPIDDRFVIPNWLPVLEPGRVGPTIASDGPDTFDPAARDGLARVSC